MAGKPVMFDEEAAQRIADVVRDYSPPVQNVAGDRGPVRRPYNTQTFAKITGSTLTSGVYYHTWTEQQRTATGWEAKPEGLTSTTAATAIMPDKSQVATDTYVALVVEYLLDDDTIVATIMQSASPPAGDVFIARVSGSSQDGSNKRWVYTFVELAQSAAGYANFTDKSGGRTGDAYNVIEAANGSSGTFGNGVTSSNLTGSLAIKPVPTGTRVMLRQFVLSGGNTFWFSYANGIDGGCT